MKKSLSLFVTAALLAAGAVHAEINPRDSSAKLDVRGVAFNPNANCKVELHPTTISMESTIDQLHVQDTDQLPAEIVNLTVNGDSSCLTMVSEGKMVYRFIGIADDATGKVLANADTSAQAATGVGIGIFSYLGNPIALNTDTINATTDKFGLRLVSLDREVPATTGNVTGTLTVQIERL